MVWRAWDRDRALPDEPLDAATAQRVALNLQASNEDRMLSGNIVFDETQPVRTGSLDWRGFPSPWIPSPESRTIKVTYRVAVYWDFVNVRWRAYHSSGRFVDLKTTINQIPPLGSPVVLTDTLDMKPVQELGGGFIKICMWMKSDENTGLKYPFVLDLSQGRATYVLKSTTSISAAIPGHTALDPYKVVLEDVSGVPIATRALQVQRVEGDEAFVYPLVDPDVWELGAGNTPRNMSISRLGTIDIYSILFEEEHGTPYAEGRSFPWQDTDDMRAALSPDMPPRALTERALYLAGQYLFTDRTPVQAIGPAPFVRRTSTAEPDVYPWSARGNFGGGTPAVIWSARVNEATSGGAGYTDQNGNNANRGGIDIYPVLLPICPPQAPAAVPMDIEVVTTTTGGGGATYVFPRAYSYQPRMYGPGDWLDMVYRPGVGRTNLQPLIQEADFASLGVVVPRLQILGAFDLETITIRVVESNADDAYFFTTGGGVGARTICMGAVVVPTRSGAWSSIGV